MTAPKPNSLSAEENSGVLAEVVPSGVWRDWRAPWSWKQHTRW